MLLHVTICHAAEVVPLGLSVSPRKTVWDVLVHELVPWQLHTSSASDQMKSCNVRVLVTTATVTSTEQILNNILLCTYRTLWDQLVCFLREHQNLFNYCFYHGCTMTTCVSCCEPIHEIFLIRWPSLFPSTSKFLGSTSISRYLVIFFLRCWQRFLTYNIECRFSLSTIEVGTVNF